MRPVMAQLGVSDVASRRYKPVAHGGLFLPLSTSPMSSSPIACLPPELLLAVFAFATSPPAHFIPLLPPRPTYLPSTTDAAADVLPLGAANEYTHPPVHLSHVCCTWRTLCLASPTLWARSIGSIPSTTAIAHFIHRAHPATPLDIVVRTGTSKPSQPALPNVSTWIAEAARVRSIDVDMHVPAHDAATFVSALSGTYFPSLVELSVHTTTWSPPAPCPTPPCDGDAQALHAPELRTAYLTNLLIPLSHAPNLTALVLDSAFALPTPSARIDPVLALLRACPALEDLTVNLVVYSFDPQPSSSSWTAFSLPSLALVPASASPTPDLDLDLDPEIDPIPLPALETLTLLRPRRTRDVRLFLASLDIPSSARLFIPPPVGPFDLDLDARTGPFGVNTSNDSVPASYALLSLVARRAWACSSSLAPNILEVEIDRRSATVRIYGVRSAIVTDRVSYFAEEDIVPLGIACVPARRNRSSRPTTRGDVRSMYALELEDILHALDADPAVDLAAIDVVHARIGALARNGRKGDVEGEGEDMWAGVRRFVPRARVVLGNT